MPKRVQDIIPAGMARSPVREKKVEVAEEAEAEPFVRVKKEKKEQKAPEKNVEELYIPEQKVPLRKIVTPIELIRNMEEERPKKKSSSRKLKASITVLAIIVVIGLAGYFASAYFSRAVFTVTPRKIPVSVNNTLIVSAAPISGSLSYTLLSFRDSATTTVPATIGQQTESKAKGTVAFYNSYSANPWRLIAGTRFQDDAGLVYRLSSTIIIPGFSKSSTGAFIPGTIQALLVADQAGEQYNAIPSDPLQKLRVVAYKGDAKYETIYSKVTANISGGFIGNKVTVSPALLASTTANLRAMIIQESMASIKNSVPDGYILYNNAYSTVFGDPAVSSNNASKNATVSLQGTVYGITFKRDELVSKIAGPAIVQSFGNYHYDTPGLDALSFNITNAKDFSPIKKNNLIVQIKGSMNIVGVVPVQELKAKFAGMALSGTQPIMSSYSPVIDLSKSSGQVVPPWSKIPKDPQKISIIVQD